MIEIILENAYSSAVQIDYWAKYVIYALCVVRWLDADEECLLHTRDNLET